jgi:hypothetical protein
MLDRTSALDLIERAIDTDPYCPVCHAQTMIHDEDGRIFLICSATREPHGLLGRVGATLLPHFRRELLDLRPDMAA